MSNTIKITLPMKEECITGLRAGDYVLLSGEIYTARDAAHKRLSELIEGGQSLPVSLKGQIIYYMGPSPARPDKIIGSAGPTTSTRMDKYTPKLLDLGLKGMIGKGRRSREVLDSIIKNHAVYFAAIGGEGALLSKQIIKSEIICYEDLGTEAIRKLTVRDFPVIVAADCHGGYIYDEAVKKWRLEEK